MTKRKNGHRVDQQRTTIADAAARLMLEDGVTDYRAAKSRALDKLGLRGNTALPTNAEIEAALTSRQKIFRGDTQESLLQELRKAALGIMEQLDVFQPRLVGPVLAGNATEHVAIEIHLFADAPEDIARKLDALGIKHKSVRRRHQWRRGETVELPGFRFYCGDHECVASIIPQRRRGHPPLSPVNGRPMERAGTARLRGIISVAQDQSPPSAW